MRRPPNSQGGAREVAFQTGTVAGLIKLTPSFQSEIGGFDVTPDPVPELQVFSFAIPRPNCWTFKSPA